MKNQKPRTLDDQLSTLKNRGMHFLNEQLAKEFLNRISYFRLKYFWIDMLDMEYGDFKKDIYFEALFPRSLSHQILFDEKICLIHIYPFIIDWHRIMVP